MPNTGPEVAAASKAAGKLLLVLPFDNRSGQPGLDWIGEAVPEVLNRRLASAGYTVIGRGDRQYALDHLGLPTNFEPSRATALRLAQTLDADYIVVGFFTEQGDTFRASAQMLDVNALRLGSPIVEQAGIHQLLDVLNSVAWRVARTLDPKYPVAENTFIATGAHLRLDGFENYTRGLVESEPAERIRHLKDAVAENPQFSPAWLALGLAYFAEQQFEPAALALGHLPKTDPSALQAEFYRGLAFFYTGSYPKALDAFAFVATQLPLPEVVNNEGVAQSRRGRDGSGFFQQAIAADPHDEDFHFNLAVALARKGDIRGAQSALAQALKLRPEDSEAQSFMTLLRTAPPAPTPPPPTPATTAAATPPTAAIPATANRPLNVPGNLPLERIKRSFNDASFRQAASEIEQVQAMRLASLPPAQRAAALAKEGQRYLDQGLLLEAEREFQLALAADSGNAAAHTGLAEVRARNGDTSQARQEAQAAIKLQPSAAAYIVLAKLDMTANQNSTAAADIDHALALEPANTAARGMKQALAAKAQATP
ncbi:MAG: tetratricopeptide repeat protein [Acidobacteriaceae bacterium]